MEKTDEFIAVDGAGVEHLFIEYSEFEYATSISGTFEWWHLRRIEYRTATGRRVQKVSESDFKIVGSRERVKRISPRAGRADDGT